MWRGRVIKVGDGTYAQGRTDRPWSTEVLAVSSGGGGYRGCQREGCAAAKELDCLETQPGLAQESARHGKEEGAGRG